MTQFEVERLIVGVAAGGVLGWLVGSPPGSFASIQWLNLFSAVGTVGAAVGAIWIATNQRRNQLRDQRLSGALQMMKRRHWLSALMQELEQARSFSWPTEAERQECGEALRRAEGEGEEVSQSRAAHEQSTKWDPYGGDAAQLQAMELRVHARIQEAETALKALEARAETGKMRIEAIAKKIDALDSIPSNGDPVFSKLAYLARSNLDAAMELTRDPGKASDLSDVLATAGEFLSAACGRIDVADALVKSECAEFSHREDARSQLGSDPNTQRKAEA